MGDDSHDTEQVRASGRGFQNDEVARVDHCLAQVSEEKFLSKTRSLENCCASSRENSMGAQDLIYQFVLDESMPGRVSLSINCYC